MVLRRAAAVVLSTLSLLCLRSKAAEAPPPLVTCGSVIKLRHDSSNHNLHSHEIAYGYGHGGSGQQSVTAYPGGDDSNDYWVVHGTKEEPCKHGAPVSNGQILRLLHSRTSKWLHSHLYSSPLTNNQEVSAFGTETESDTGDVWAVEWDVSLPYWRRDTKVRFKHKDTSVYLISHNRKYGRPIANQQEVCGIRTKSASALWVAVEGVYLPETPRDV